MAIVAILSIGLINILLYSAAAGASTPQTRVIVGDTRQYMEYEDLAPTMQPWENGLRTNPMPGTFEWWYFQGTFDDGSHAEITFLVKPRMNNSGPLDPYVGFSLTTPNGTVHRDQIHVSTDKFFSARNTLNVTMANNWVRGDLKTINLHTESPKGFGADLVFNSAAPPGRFDGAGLISSMYIARGNQVVYDIMKGVSVNASGRNITDTSGAHNYPETLNLHWQNGTDTVNLALTNPKIVQAGRSVVRTDATIVGTPEYLRLSGNGTLNVNIAGANETESGPAVWEVNYGH